MTTRGSCSISRSFRRSSHSQARSKTRISPTRIGGRSSPRARAKKATGPVEAFKEHGSDFVVANSVDAACQANECSSPEATCSTATSVEREISARDSQLDNRFGKDLQIAAIRQARNYLGDKLIRTTPLHRILDPKAGPLIAVKLNILTRKTLGGFETDLAGRVFARAGEIFPGFTPPARPPASAAAACTDTERSREAFWADASSPAAPPGEQPPAALA